MEILNIKWDREKDEEIKRLNGRVAELEAGLAPFAAYVRYFPEKPDDWRLFVYYGCMDPSPITIGHVRKAAALLNGTQQESGEV